MATSGYMDGRKKYSRPQGLLLSNNPGQIVDGKRIPQGEEFKDFIILSDNNRGPIAITSERIEQRKRTINGRMRSYHVADKISISVNWDMLPSRAFLNAPNFNTFDGKPTSLVERIDSLDVGTGENVSRPVKPLGSPYFKDQQFTTDGGAGGVEILEWYNATPGSFWVFLAYDNYANFEQNPREKLSQYNDVIEVFFASFNYSIEKRSGTSHDYWNISFSLEEV
jgi:hypothetical protein